ncbi:uncharacterized protein LOC142984636 [Anticarsia gemmatalis]|uniref:uncharacterized protein LOC142984636 n=1 Tax=Anticarsia gemmatalis TaxID=129554 RepID=UPI003F759ACB
MEINIQLFDRICRVCLIQSAELKSLFSKKDGDERSLLEILTYTANINVKVEDNLPKQVCIACESIMCKADAFKRRCQESETILNNVYQNASTCGESTNNDQNCAIKDEKTDLQHKLLEYGTLVAPVTTNNGFKDNFDKKNIVLQDFPICSTNDDIFAKFPDSKLPDNYEQPVKEETVNNVEEQNDFLDHFDDGDQFLTVPIEYDEPVTKKPTPLSKKFGIRYQCYCGTQFPSKEKYKSHLKVKKCNACKIERLGRDKNGVKNQLQCSFCLRKFKNKTSLAAHIERHEKTDNIKHVCEVCKREFRYKAYLENHMLTAHTKTNGFACDICAQSFLNKDLLETHKKSHDNEKKHRCTVCSKSFLMLCTLKEHMRTHTGEKPFLCSQCGKGFSQKTNLAQHMRRHQGLKPFKCETCEKRFVSKGELDAHNRKHSGAHPFVCDECGNGFTTSSALVKHRRIHTGERPYHCDLCPMRFAASGTLKNHRRTHTGERPFQCSYCEKAFVQRNDLISHIRCHTGERPYICTQCGQAFRKASGLKTHVKMHIKDPIVGVNAILTSMHCTEQ